MAPEKSELLALTYVPLISKVLVGTVLFFSAAVTGGWILSNYISLPWMGGTIKQGAAISFVFLSLALVMSHHSPESRWMRLLGKILLTFVIVLGAANSIEHLLKIDFGIDLVLGPDTSEPEKGGVVGRMALSVSLCFLFLGVAILEPGKKVWLQIVNQYLLGTVFFISLLTFLGFIYNAESWYKNLAFLQVSGYTSLCFLLLSISVLFIRQNIGFVRILTSKSPGGVFARRISAAVLLLPPLIGRLGLSLSSFDQLDEGVSFALVAGVNIVALGIIVWKSAYSLNATETKREALEQAYLKSLAQLNALLSSAPLGLGFIDTELRFIKGNQFLSDLGGSDLHQLEGKRLTELNSEFVGQAEPFIRKVIKSGKPILKKEIKIQNHGKLSYLASNFFPVRALSGESIGVGVSFLDITESKLYQMELLRMRDAANEASRAKTYFLANMSHEIRTPIGIIMGFVELLKSPNLSTADVDGYIETIDRNSRQLIRVIDDILDLSKIEAGKVSAIAEPINVAEFLEDLKSSLTLKARSKNLDFQMEISGYLPERICSDNTRLRQVIFNVVGNAIKFTSQGSVNVSVFGKDSRICFRVKDTGKGISSDKIKNIFQPFSQEDSSTTREYGGTGLGLVLSKRLAQVLGGDVILEKTIPGGGSTFLISVDMGEVESEKLLGGREHQLRRTATPTVDYKSIFALRNKSILLVEDSLDNQVIVSFLLKKVGATVELASDGAEGLSKALNGNFDLVLMDVQMPVMDGYEAVKKLRSQGYRKPVIALTAHAMKEERERCLMAGFDSHIAKPINRHVFFRTVSSYLETQESPEGQPESRVHEAPSAEL
jgi:PAS domain S-box-containing protein